MKSETEQSVVNSRIFGLDLLRCIAIVLVLIAHTIRPLGDNVFINASGIYGAVWGVEIFFVLSGFLIGTILIKIHNQHPVTSLDSIKIFLIRRWFRTLPNYYLMLCVYMLLYYISPKLESTPAINPFPFLFFLQNVTPTFPHLSFFGISWSLCIEEWFYLLFPIVMFLIQFISGNKYTSLFRTIIFFMLIPLLFRLWVAERFDWPWDEGFRKVMPLRLDSIAIGVLAALFKFYSGEMWHKRKNIMAIMASILLLTMLILLKFDFIDNYDAQKDIPTGSVSLFLNTVFFSVNSLAIAMFIPFFYSIKSNYSFYGKVITTISLISYSLYLSHPLVITIVGHFFRDYPIVNFILTWSISIVGAYFQYHLFEKRFTSFRDSFGKKKDAVGLLN
ncbi:acyltransferase family protein [Spirosoma aerolatum]|uniref:acyltransferase family protein n=1 Tax=Spirosoma aerolatum TaxID=1211326 RepID=UPI0009ACEABF|nr:acyltransferase [Spirosoma aerolatum]